MRLAVYTDYPCRGTADGVFAERAFVLFLDELAHHFDRFVLAGRLHPERERSDRSHYRVADEIEFVPLPHYESLAKPVEAARAFRGSMDAFGRILEGVDAVWLLGPHPLCLPFAAQARRTRRMCPCSSAFKQDLPAYAHPPPGSARLSARCRPIGARLAEVGGVLPHGGRRTGSGAQYAGARRCSRSPSHSFGSGTSVFPTSSRPRSYDGALTALSVGRLETEKNPVVAGGRARAARRRLPVAPGRVREGPSPARSRIDCATWAWPTPPS